MRYRPDGRARLRGHDRPQARPHERGHEHRHGHPHGHPGLHWRHMHRAMRDNPEARAAVHAWLREFEARMVYGLDDKRWAWRRGGRSLGRRLTLIFVALAAGLLGLDHWLGEGWWLALAALVAGGVAYAAVRVALRPLWRLGLGVAAFGRGDLAQRIPVRRRDEIGALGARFNQMADDIVGMLDAKRALLLAISHELRSPITRARLNAELLEEGPQRDALVADLGLMRDLVEALIERERLDAGHAALLQQPADWPAWLGALVAKRFAAAEAAGALVVVTAPGLPALQADRMRVELLVGNLVDNALRHNDAAAGPVRVGVERRGAELVLEVRDCGPGVPEEALERMAEPFYRPDASRSRASGGVGLGLSLCKLIADAHGAAFEIRNAAPGLAVSVRFPLGMQ